MIDTALSKRAYKALKAATEIILGQRIDDEQWQPDPEIISQFSVTRFLCLPNCGRSTIKEIEGWFAAYGLTFENKRRQTSWQRREAHRRRIALAQSLLNRLKVPGPHSLDAEEADVVRRALRALLIAGAPQDHPHE